MGENQLLSLKNVGKIYTEEGATTVGISGVTASFDRGEFVLLTGESGAGKTTLLNVIGGMDHIEEGEVSYCGEAFSACGTNELDYYRDNHVSFIFQNYCIIESLSVRDNVAMGMLGRVGREEQVSECNRYLKKLGLMRMAGRKAGKLSGGQKQRVAVARALASRREIILADEPTAHLDNENSGYIVEALAEASCDSLVIVSTHEPERFAECATRIIRMADGAVCEDRMIPLATDKKQEAEELCGERKEQKNRQNSQEKQKNKQLRSGLSLGWKLCSAYPRKVSFLFVLCLFSALLMALVTGALSMSLRKNASEDGDLFRGDGTRVVITNRNGTAIAEEELITLAKQSKAEVYLHCDILMDSGDTRSWYRYVENPGAFAPYVDSGWTPPYRIETTHDVGTPDIGRYPENESECLLCVPYALREYYGAKTIKRHYEKLYGVDYRIVGVKYYLQNDIQGQVLLTQEGYRLCALMAYLGEDLCCDITIRNGEEIVVKENAANIRYDYDVEPDEIAFKSNDGSLAVVGENTMSADLQFVRKNSEGKESAQTEIGEVLHSKHVFINSETSAYEESNTIVLHPSFVMSLLQAYMENNYRQGTLLYSDSESAENAVEMLSKAGYLTATGDDRYDIGLDSARSELYYVAGAYLGIIGAFAVMGLLLSFCISRMMQSMKYSVTVMRAVGVDRTITRTSLYALFFLPFMISIALMTAIFIFAYRSSFFSRYFLWLRWYHYAWINAGMMIIIWMTVENHRKKALAVSVKDALLKGE